MKAFSCEFQFFFDCGVGVAGVADGDKLSFELLCLFLELGD